MRSRLIALSAEQAAAPTNYYEVGDTRYPLLYGMTATAEVVVRERRLIDLALDPFRQVGG